MSENVKAVIEELERERANAAARFEEMSTALGQILGALNGLDGVDSEIKARLEATFSEITGFFGSSLAAAKEGIDGTYLSEIARLRQVLDS